MAQLDGNGTWVPEDTIAQKRRTASDFWQTPAGGYGSGFGGGLAAALSGLGYGLNLSNADADSRSNQALKSSVLKNAADAKDNMSMGRMLMAAGIPGLDETGLKTIASERDLDAQRAFQEKMQKAGFAHADSMQAAGFQHSKDMLPLQTAEHLAQARGMAPIELETAEAKARLQQKLDQERWNTMFPSAATAPAAAAPTPSAASTLSAIPGNAPKIPTNIPQTNAGAMGGGPPPSPTDAPANGLPPGVTPEQFQRAKRAWAMGNKEMAAKILAENEEKKGNEAYDAQNGKDLAEAATKLREDAQSARNGINTTQALRQLVTSGAMSMGPGSEMGNAVRRMGAALGINSEKLNNAQLFEAIVNELGLGKAQNMKGALSDKDIIFIKSMGPSLMNTKEGNLLMLDYLDRVNKRRVDVARMAENYRRNNNGRIDEKFYDALQTYADQNPLFTDQERVTPSKAGPATAGKLPSGFTVQIMPSSP